MSIHDIFTYSRAMPDELQQNSSMGDSPLTVEEAVERFDRKKKGARREMKNRSTTSNNDNDMDMATVLDRRFKESNEREATAFDHMENG
jgi:hypothetical protein